MVLQIDFLVNNAGLAQAGSAIGTSHEVDQYVVDVNVLGTISLTKAVLPYMVDRKTGQIVVITSALGKVIGEFKTSIAPWHTRKKYLPISWQQMKGNLKNISQLNGTYKVISCFLQRGLQKKL